MIPLGAVFGELHRGAAPPADPASPRPEQAAAVDQALLFDGLPAGRVKAAVVIGAGDAGLLQAIFQRCPALSSALLIEPDVGALQAAMAAVGRQGWGAIDPARCQLASLPAGSDPTFELAVYLEVCAFLAAQGIALDATAVVLDPRLQASVPHLRSLAMVRDFLSEYSARFFASPHNVTAVGPPVLRTLADYLFHVGEHYHALKFYWSLHAAGPSAELAARICHCLLELPCPAWAQRWVGQSGLPADTCQRLSPAHATLAALQHEQQQATRHRNLEALTTHHPLAAQALTAVDPAAGDRCIEIVTLPAVPWQMSAEGQRASVQRAPYALLVEIGRDGLRELNPPPAMAPLHGALTAETALAAAHVGVAGWVRQACAAQLFLTADHAVDQPGWKRLVMLAEADPVALAALLRAVDLTAALSGARALLFVGRDAEQQLLRFLEQDPRYCVPGILLGATPALDQALGQIERERNDRARREMKTLDERYDDARTRRILDVLEGRQVRPLRVFFLTSLYTSVVRHVLADLARAFEERGDQVTMLLEERAGQDLHAVCVTSRLLEVDPDLVIVVNHSRAEAHGVFPAGLPVVTWIQDELPGLKDPARIAALGDLDLTYAFSTSVRDLFRVLGYPHSGHLPFAVDRASITADIPRRCRNEVLYATHLVDPGEPSCVPGLREWLEQTLSREQEISLSLPAIAGLIMEGSATLGLTIAPERHQEVLYWGLMVARALDRVRAADTVIEAGIPIALHGRGWERFPRFRAHARGVLSTGEPLRRALAEHKVTLHINRGCNLHPRVLEGFAAGGFVLARHDPADDLPGDTVDQFDIGRELLLFRSPDEMVALVRRAMEDEDWRRSVILAAQARMLRSHTYGHRTEVILKDLRAQLPRYLDHRHRAA